MCENIETCIAGRCPLQVLREVLPDQGDEPAENSAALRAAARALRAREPQYEMKTYELGAVRMCVPRSDSACGPGAPPMPP